MLSSIATRCLLLSLFTTPLLAQTDTPYIPSTSKHAMVVTIQHNASDAGLEVLKEGGNAVDAAVAVGFALAVTYPVAGNLGGGGFMLVRMKTDQHGKALKAPEAHFLDYRERAPTAATADMYLDKDKNVIKGLSTVGYKAIGVPGTVAGLTYAQKTYGRLTLAQDMAPAIRLATNGFELTAEETKFLQTKYIEKDPESHRIYQRNGDFYKPGETFAQPELAKTLARIATNPGDFYHGDIAKRLAAFVQAGGGLITEKDLADYQVKDRTPLYGKYHGYDIITSPPPSSGGIVLLEILNILSTYDLPKLGADRSAAQMHIITEAFRRAYMDRSDYLGDPDFNDMPLTQMADPKYAAAWRESIDPIKPTPSEGLKRPAGFLPPPPAVPPVHESPQTTHFSVVDKDGNAASSTYTLNSFFGAGITAGNGLAFALNDEMDDFTAKVGVPNMFRLIQGPANSIAPGKRPLSAMTPTMIIKDSKLVMILGSPGGSTIITTVANDLISVLDNHLSIQQAADAPRFHHQYLPDRLDVEKKFPIAPVNELKETGYTVNRAGEFDEKSPGQWGDSELIYIDPKSGLITGGQDQRRHFGKAAGY
ncbi:Gamma-glutamyltranspeptidase [Granulicella sibirica]|uniref:Glutathione hydrolase proenzyme n=1 Tax=Granulicella sibirica TaxID=2479048 RepID=A0A4Q0T707_9BACT|nr:Gamma-glutamyltranspeptidase [Granulicella sibirica]